MKDVGFSMMDDESDDENDNGSDDVDDDNHDEVWTLALPLFRIRRRW